MSFAEGLYMLRTGKGISQKELADTLGVAQSSINYWEKGQRDPSISIVEKIADYFGISVDEMIGWNPRKTVGQNLATMKIQTLAAHLEGDEFTEEELEEIRKFAEFIKSKRKDND